VQAAAGSDSDAATKPDFERNPLRRRSRQKRGARRFGPAVPGATLINLKLSGNARFQDKAGACKLIETAVSRGDQAMAVSLSECGYA